MQVNTQTTKETWSYALFIYLFVSSNDDLQIQGVAIIHL